MSEIITRNIMDYFPLAKARKNQVQVLKAIEKAFADGYKNVLLEAPVGSGKSAIAVAAAKFYGSAHILTPRKSLQDQYLEDFGDKGLVLMKGRNAYPCTYPSTKNLDEYEEVVNMIGKGQPIPINFWDIDCASGPCKNNLNAYVKCTNYADGEAEYPCPYNVAITVAQDRDTVIHNLHSFIFQGFFAARFETRPIIIVDECHEMEGIIRGFAEIKFDVPMLFDDNDIPTREDNPLLEHWAQWFTNFAEMYSEAESSDGKSERSEYLEKIQRLVFFSEQFGEKFVMDREEGQNGRSTRFTFIPEQVGYLTNKYLLDFGEKRLLMSGTIYNKKNFCIANGIKEEETCFMRIGSTFPIENRPIYAKSDYMVDTSHKHWDANFREMVDKIQTVMDVFDDAKGLIHTPSYHASQTLFNALKHTDRVLMHDKDNFQEVLQGFYDREDSAVLLSPVCQQGVDFKGDRARFQIVLRVPYLNTGDAFIKHKVETDFTWYNHQALVIFGQQIGRVVRSDDDFGVTVLMDERFGKFLSRNKNQLPKWLMDAVIYK